MVVAHSPRPPPAPCKNKRGTNHGNNNHAHYKTNSRIIRRIIRFGLVLELSGW